MFKDVFKLMMMGFFIFIIGYTIHTVNERQKNNPEPIDNRSDIEKDWQGFNGTVEKTIIDNRVGRKTLVITGYEGDTIKTRWYKLIGNEWHSCILM